MLKKECWELGAERARAVPLAVAATTAATVEAADDAADAVTLPLWGSCVRAPAGSGHLFDC